MPIPITQAPSPALLSLAAATAGAIKTAGGSVLAPRMMEWMGQDRLTLSIRFDGPAAWEAGQSALEARLKEARDVLPYGPDVFLHAPREPYDPFNQAPESGQPLWAHLVAYAPQAETLLREVAKTAPKA